MLPSKPRIVSETETKGVYEIDNLYPGYGHTLGNSLRRIILSSLPGAAITSLKIDGAPHEFTSLDGVKEDVLTILLSLKRIRFKMVGDEPQLVTLSVKGPKVVTAEDLTVPGQIEVLNPEQYICEVTAKGRPFTAEFTIERGLGFVSKDVHQKVKTDVGVIAIDAIFSPIRRVAYEVENMRVGDKTNFNRLRITIETDGTIGPREALESSIEIMITQLKAIFDFSFESEKELPSMALPVEAKSVEKSPKAEVMSEDMTDVLKTRIDGLDLSTRTQNALSQANIRTIGGIARKRTEDLLEIEGIGEKGIQEIKKVLSAFNISLKD